ncbi:MAG TPA: S9 family peptidase [Vicinamibacterales bacterium]|nr:S9 family peptidase [Vicinamibacterales bacterium]
MLRALATSVCLGAAMLVPTPAAAQPPAPSSQTRTTAMTDKLPPLIDRQHFFGDPEIAGAQVSPDGQFIAFLRPFNGTRNIWVKRAGEPFDKARPITADTRRPISNYLWSRDGKFVLFVQDQGGDENYNVYAVNPAETPPKGAEVPGARNLTEASGVRAMVLSVPKSDPDAIYVGLNDRDKAWHDFYRVRISDGTRTLIAKNTDRFTGAVFDLKDRLRMVVRTAESGETELLRVDGEASFTKIYTCNIFETCVPVRFHKDGQRVYVMSNKGENVNLIGLVLIDAQTGKEEFVEADPLKRVDLADASFSEVTDELIATAYLDDRIRLYWKDKGFEADYRLLQQKLGEDKEISLGSSTTDERLFIVNASSDVEPGETYLFDRESKDLQLQYRIREQLPREALAPMKAIRFKSSDGLEIPAYLTLPRGVEPKSLPLIVVPHGGPWARDDWGYDAFAQFLANRGYAVLMPNFRGSTGYGKQFLDAGNLQWGDKMQDDITWGVKHLVAEGIADPKRVGIMGGSYGGYATLAGVAFTPDLYAAGVSIVGPSNLITLLKSIPPYWEAARKIFHERMGDPTTPEGQKQLERQSPLNAANKIRTPLLVIQGANDPRVNKNESDQIVVALRERGFPVEYIVAPDEGHGFARPVNNMASFAAAEKFLAKHLGGRFQESMPPDVATRLEEITVDPKTVTVKKEADAATAVVPKTAAPLPPGTSTYKARVELGPQSMEMDITTEVREEGDTLLITETAMSPAGEAIDRTVIDKATLTVRRRTATQGPVKIDYEVKDGKLFGEMQMGGDPKPMTVDLGGELFADGAGSHQVVATLPLEPGYKTAFRNFDMRTQSPQVVQLQVVGAEEVTVPAGTFQATKVELTSADGSKTTVWVVQDTRKVVKVSAVSMAMGGATITSELVKQ